RVRATGPRWRGLLHGYVAKLGVVLGLLVVREGRSRFVGYRARSTGPESDFPVRLGCVAFWVFELNGGGAVTGRLAGHPGCSSWGPSTPNTTSPQVFVIMVVV